MPSEEHERLVDQHLERLTQAEDEAYKSIDGKLTARHNRIIKRIQRNYKRIARNQDLLPHQKALLLRESVGKMNIAEDDYRTIFNRLYGVVDATSMDTAQQMVRLRQGKEAGKVSSRDQIIEYWREDSNTRMNRWGRDYESRVTGLFEMAFQERWGSRRLQGEVESQLGRTRKNTRRIIRTSSQSVSNQGMKQFYNGKNIEFVVWVATLDDRICPYCSARNTNIYRMGEVLVPAHPNCRCVLIPVDKTDVLNGKFGKEWAKKYRKEGLDDLKDAGGKANNGLTPFEKSSGRNKPPKPVWTPEKGFARGERPQRITKTQLRFLTLPQLKELAASRGLSDDRVKKLGKTSLAKKETWRRAIAADSRE